MTADAITMKAHALAAAEHARATTASFARQPPAGLEHAVWRAYGGPREAIHSVSSIVASTDATRDEVSASLASAQKQRADFQRGLTDLSGQPATPATIDRAAKYEHLAQAWAAREEMLRSALAASWTPTPAVLAGVAAVSRVAVRLLSGLVANALDVQLDSLRRAARDVNATLRQFDVDVATAEAAAGERLSTTRWSRADLDLLKAIAGLQIVRGEARERPEAKKAA